MSRLVWDDPSERSYEFGVDRGVFYPLSGKGVPWNGLISVSETPSGSDISVSYYDGKKFHQRRRDDSFSGTIEAYTYPREFEPYNGLNERADEQHRSYFGLSYRSKQGTALNSEFGYKIHLVWNVFSSPSARNDKTITSSLEPITFSWDISTVPNLLSDGTISAHFTIDSTICYPWALTVLEDILYGNASNEPRFPSMQEVLNIFENASIFRVTDNGDGTATIDGPAEAVQMLDSITWQLSYPSVVQIDTDSYRLSSL